MESEFNREFCGKGRTYLLGKDVYIKYAETARIKKLITENIREYIFIDASIRLTIDSDNSEAQRLTISLPCSVDSAGIIANLADLLYNKLYSYYISAEPKIHHFGFANTALEGFSSSTLRRELESVCKVLGRSDVSGRLISGIQFEKDKTAHDKNFAFYNVLKKNLDAHIGYRILLYGPQMHNMTFFIPISSGAMIIKQVMYNIEMIMHHNFVTYDDVAEQGYLRLSESLILKELNTLLSRAKNKENVRKKIINNVKFATTITDDPIKRYGEMAGDYVYDTINQIDNNSLVDASDRSRALYDTLSIKTAKNVEETINYRQIENVGEIIVNRRELRDSYEEVSAATPDSETATTTKTKDYIEESEDFSNLSSLGDDMGLDEL